MLLTIHHETVYRYKSAANYSIQHVRLTPFIDGSQRILHWKIDLPGKRWRQVDAFGNVVHSASVTESHDEVRIVAQGVVETIGVAGQLMPNEGAVPVLAYALPTTLTEGNSDISALLKRPVHAGLGASLPENTHGMASLTADDAKTLMDRVFSGMEYVPGATDVTASAVDAWATKKGVCQDMAHVFLAACRAHGVPARYVSGYLLTDADHAATHAWVDVWCADGNQQGWLALDVTHNAVAGQNLCRLAVGRDYSDASPVRGSRMGGAGEEMAVDVRVGQAAQQ
jgi:transglutaminase-like putative cysteine protease